MVIAAADGVARGRHRGGDRVGKTTVAKTIAGALPQGGVAMIEYDAYYRDRSVLSFEDRSALNFDHPTSSRPSCSWSTSRPSRRAAASTCRSMTSRRTGGRRVTPVEAAKVVIVEGILVFVDPRVRECLDMKIFVDTDPDIRVFRRIRRDMEHRGRTFESIASSTTGRCARCTCSSSSRRSAGPT